MFVNFEITDFVGISDAYLEKKKYLLNIIFMLES